MFSSNLKHSTPWATCVVLILAASAQADDFPQVFNTQNQADKLSTPQEALKGMRVPQGFQVSLFAEEPAVQQPIGFTTDERGRLWVAENYTYADRSKDYDLSLRDRILIFEDTNHDGRFDKRTVFWDGAQKLTSVAVGFGGVWALCAPNLLFLPDKNRDDVPDGPPQVVLDGFNHDAIRHNIVNGLKWGPDGWLYGCHGITATSSVGLPGATDSQRTKLNCSLWRYHPTHKNFEVITHGTTNPWGFDYDDHGQMFLINTVIGHLWHVVPGAHFQRMFGSDFNPYLYQLLPQAADHFHWDTGEAWSDIRKGISDTTSQAGGGHAHCGLMIYLADQWPAKYRNSLFTVNLHGRRLNNDRLERQGNGYVAHHDEDFMFASDPWFRAVELLTGPDGGVFLADWSDVGECHENDGVHRTSGRIYKITYGQPKPLAPFDLAAASDEQLVEYQLHANDWYVRTARRLLQERAVAGKDMKAAQAALSKIFTTHPDITRQLRALWCLYSMGALDEAQLLDLLKHPNEHARLWGVKLLTDNAPVSAKVADRLADVAKEEPSNLVRLYLASALQRMQPQQRWAVASSLVGYQTDAQDRHQPLMVWYGVEAAVPLQPQQALDLARTSKLPLVRQFIARRLTTDLEKTPQVVDSLLALLRTAPDAAYQIDILQGMNDALRGWRQAPIPQDWPATAKLLATSS